MLITSPLTNNKISLTNTRIADKTLLPIQLEVKLGINLHRTHNHSLPWRVCSFIWILNNLLWTKYNLSLGLLNQYVYSNESLLYISGYIWSIPRQYLYWAYKDHIMGWLMTAISPSAPSINFLPSNKKGVL